MSGKPLSKPSKGQLEVFDWIVTFVGLHGFPPTRSEISNRFGWKSPQAAQDYLERLQTHGLVKLTPGISRGIQILEAA